MDRNTYLNLFQDAFLLRGPRVAVFVDIIKIVTIFIKTVLNTQAKLKEL